MLLDIFYFDISFRISNLITYFYRVVIGDQGMLLFLDLMIKA